MGKSKLVQAVAFSTLLSLSSTCSTFKTPPSSYTYENQTTEQIYEEQDRQKKIQEDKSNLRKAGEFMIEYTLRGLSIAQYWIM